MNTSEAAKNPTLLDVIMSVLAAMFGVQKRENHERDFTKGRFHHYAIAGLVLTTLFVMTVMGVVKLVMHIAGL